MWNTSIIFLLTTLIVAGSGCSEDGRWQEELSYHIVREKVSDEPPRMQVDQWLTVSGNLTEQNLRNLLRARFDSVMADTGYTANKQPTNVYIYLFSSSAAAEKGGADWLAMLEKRPGSDVSIRVRQQTAASSPN